jgi:hypothetical protein
MPRGPRSGHTGPSPVLDLTATPSPQGRRPWRRCCLQTSCCRTRLCCSSAPLLLLLLLLPDPPLLFLCSLATPPPPAAGPVWAQLPTLTPAVPRRTCTCPSRVRPWLAPCLLRLSAPDQPPPPAAHAGPPPGPPHAGPCCPRAGPRQAAAPELHPHAPALHAELRRAHTRAYALQPTSSRACSSAAGPLQRHLHAPPVLCCAARIHAGPPRGGREAGEKSPEKRRCRWGKRKDAREMENREGREIEFSKDLYVNLENCRDLLVK